MSQQSGIAVKEIIMISEQGCVSAVHVKDFWAYVEKKKLTRDALLKLKADKREEFFMRWKHGMTDMNSNWEFEYSCRTFLRNFHGLDLNDVDPYFRSSLKIKREFDSYCDAIKIQIGLWSGKREVPPEVQEVVDAVGGTLIDMDSQ